MNRLYVKIKTTSQSKPMTYEMPGDQPILELIPHLVHGIGLPTQENGQSLKYWFEMQTGILDSSKTLVECGVKNSTVLILRSGMSVPTEKEGGLKPNPFGFIQKLD
jgi:hypothetical protein